MHWLTLQFEDARLALHYRLYRAAMVRLQMRTGLLLGCALYLGFDSVDWLFAPPGWAATAHYRLLSIAAALCALVLTWWPRAFRRSYDAIGAFSGIVAMLGVVMVIRSTPAATGDAFLAALVLICLAFYLFVGLGFVAALVCNLTVLTVYLALESWIPTLSGYRLYWHAYVLVASNLTGAACAYLLERQRRLVFVRNRELTEERNRHRGLARRDRLTGLANRTYLLERLELELGVLKRGGGRAAILFLDLDGFKPINDRWGHPAGDVVLATLGRRLRTEVRATDVLARFGGDEFVILLLGLADEADAERQARRLLEAVQRPVAFRDEAGRPQTTALGASVGIDLFPRPGDTAGVVLARADEAMYRAKAERRGGIVVSGRTA